MFVGDCFVSIWQIDSELNTNYVHFSTTRNGQAFNRPVRPECRGEMYNKSEKESKV